MCLCIRDYLLSCKNWTTSVQHSSWNQRLSDHNYCLKKLYQPEWPCNWWAHDPVSAYVCFQIGFTLLCDYCSILNKPLILFISAVSVCLFWWQIVWNVFIALGKRSRTYICYFIVYCKEATITVEVLFLCTDHSFI